MLNWIRGKRLDLKTTIILLVLALAAWALVVRANVVNFIPEEFRQQESSVQDTTP